MFSYFNIIIAALILRGITTLMNVTSIDPKKGKQQIPMIFICLLLLLSSRFIAQIE